MSRKLRRLRKIDITGQMEIMTEFFLPFQQQAFH
ncbi:unnamed protein product [Camellia sinensis]